MKKEWTTVADFIAYGKTIASVSQVTTQGYDEKGDGGAVILYRTGEVGTPSQTFINTGSNTCIDANGDEWEISEGTFVTYSNPNKWFDNGFGDYGEGTYLLHQGMWDIVITSGNLLAVSQLLD